MSSTALTATQRARDLLFAHINAKQQKSWSRHKWFREQIHGRYYKVCGDSYVWTTVHKYMDTALCMFPDDSRHNCNWECPSSSPCPEHFDYPQEDIALINLLLLRHDTKNFWIDACFSNDEENYGAGDRKPLRYCIDQTHHHG